MIHSVNGAGSRSTLSASPCVVTQRETCTPIDAILRGGSPGTQTPVSSVDARCPRAPKVASVRMTASSRSRQYLLHVLAVPVEVEDRVADELARPVVGRLAAAVGLDDARPRRRPGGGARPRRCAGPRVTVGGCSSRTTVSGIAPCETAAASERCRSHASWYGVTRRARAGTRLAHHTDSRRPRLAPSGRPAQYDSRPRSRGSCRVAHERRRVGAVDQPVVVAEAEVHHRPDRDHVVPELVGDDHRALDDRLDVDDRRPAAG